MQDPPQGAASIYAEALYRDPDATLDDLREAVNTLEETIRTVRRRLGDSHPSGFVFEETLQEMRATLRAFEVSDDDTVDVSAQEDDADDTE